MASSRDVLLQSMQSVVEEFADCVAVREPTGDVTYRSFAEMVGAIRGMVQAKDPDGLSPIGLLLDRSSHAYAAMWAAIGESRAYVPLNRRYPPSRLRTIIEAAGVEYVICDSASVKQAQSLGIDAARILLLGEIGERAGEVPVDVFSGETRGDLAYILFTSGSTGMPKGVPITYDNLLAFIQNMMAVIPYPPQSICSQVCELSFDFSVHEIYVALLSGCCLCPARQIDLYNPAQFIAKNSISVWISVPSLARVVLKNPTSEPSALASIKLSIFNGEPLTEAVAREWQAAVPGSAVWNTYGPTECTVAVTAQRWTESDEITEVDIVSIGTPFPGCNVAILDGGDIIPLTKSDDGRVGELLLDTPQCFAGYLDPKLAKPFASTSGATYYKTGDRVLWRGGRLFHLGRLDHQVKIGGHRIELMEVEHHLRRALNVETLAVIAYPAKRPTELILFIEGQDAAPRLDAQAIDLPTYMMPKRSIVLETFPATSHGKLDRLALQSELETS